MILSFSKQRFVDDIKCHRKIHTIRSDKTKRWKPGMWIHWWFKSPRNLSCNPYSFRVIDRAAQEINHCISVQEITIVNADHGCVLNVFIDGRKLSESEIFDLAINDGLHWNQFVKWFVPGNGDVYQGRLIHWTNKKY